MKAKSTTWRPCWKLTRANGTTRRSTLWRPGEANPDGVRRGLGALCTRAWYHAYDGPLLALVMNSAHADIAPSDLKLWRAEWRGARRDDRGLKFGASQLRVVDTVEAPDLPPAFCVAVGAAVDALLCPGAGSWSEERYARWRDGARRPDFHGVDNWSAIASSIDRVFSATACRRRAAWALLDLVAFQRPRAATERLDQALAWACAWSGFHPKFPAW
jgi:hypothetical protein